MKRLFISLPFVALLLASCEALFIPPDSGTSQTAIFDEAWRFADREYSFFEYKGIDWDEVRSRYEPLVNDSISDDSLFNVIGAMLYELRDGHVNLRSSFNVSRNWTWYLNSPPNFNADILERSYFQERQQYVGPFAIYDFGDVGYVRYSSFSSSISGSDLNYVIEKFADHKGLILDIRNNGGGSLLNAWNMAPRFSSDTILYGRTRYKSGPGHGDFSGLEDEYIYPPEDDTTFTKPVVLLTNRSSYSASTFFTQMMRELPNVTVMGDTTGGGGGAPADTELANGWIIRVSATQLFAPDGFNVEDGIPPDEVVWITPEDEANGIDTILERALELLRQ